eukprot:571343-Rhodomonas_salina.1
MLPLGAVAVSAGAASRTENFRSATISSSNATAFRRIGARFFLAILIFAALASLVQVSDQVSTPPELASHLTEKLLLMPWSHLVCSETKCKKAQSQFNLCQECVFLFLISGGTRPHLRHQLTRAQCAMYATSARVVVRVSGFAASEEARSAGLRFASGVRRESRS